MTQLLVIPTHASTLNDHKSSVQVDGQSWFLRSAYKCLIYSKVVFVHGRWEKSAEADLLIGVTAFSNQANPEGGHDLLP